MDVHQGRDSVMLVVASMRNSLVPDIHFSYHDKVLVCDGYLVYENFRKKRGAVDMSQEYSEMTLEKHDVTIT